MDLETSRLETLDKTFGIIEKGEYVNDKIYDIIYNQIDNLTKPR